MGSFTLKCVAIALCVSLIQGHGSNGKYLDADQLSDILSGKSLPRDKTENDWRDLSRKYGSSGHTSIAHLISEVVAAREDLVLEILRPLFHKMDNVAALEETVDGLVRAQADPEPDSILCTVCSALIRAIKLAGSTGLITWEDMYDPLNMICTLGLRYVIPGVNADVICPGTLQMQGPHVFASWTTVVPNFEPRKHCEFLNVCVQDNIPRTVPPFTLPFTIFPDVAHVPPSAEREVDAMKPRLAARRQADLETALKVMQLTDVHIEDMYAEDSSTQCGLIVCCLEKWGPGTASAYGDYRCNTPPRTLDLFLDKVAEIDPDIIIYSGDNPPHTIWEETEWSQWNCTRQVLDAFNRKLPGKKIYPNIGNHEMYPTDIYYTPLQETQDMNRLFVQWWSSFAGFSAENNETMEKGSYYALDLLPGLKILSFNTNFMYSFNWYNPVTDEMSQVPPNPNPLRRMEQYMRDTLVAARAAGDKVVMVGHHPPGGADTIVKHTRLLTDLSVEFSDVIVLHISGHTHNDEFRLMKDSSEEAKGVVYVSPAMTPLGFINPAMRVYYLDENTYEVLDYDNYHLDLQKITGGTPEVEFQYRATDEYGLTDLSPASWQDLIGRMADDYGLFMTYHSNFYVRSPSGQSCDANYCRASHLCSSSNSNFDEYRRCVDTQTPTTLRPTTTTTSPPTNPDQTGGAPNLVASYLAFGLLVLVNLSV